MRPNSSQSGRSSVRVAQPSRASLMPVEAAALPGGAEVAAASETGLFGEAGGTCSFGASVAAAAGSLPQTPEIDMWRALGAMVRGRANERAMWPQSAGASA